MIHSTFSVGHSHHFLERSVGSQRYAPTVIAKVNEAVVKTLADPAVIKRLTDLGQEIPPREQLTPSALAAFHKSEIERWWPLIKDANIKIE